jgi:DNA-binding NtrC family response regulator
MKVATAQTPDAALQLLAVAGPGHLAVLSDFNLKAPMNGLQLLHAAAQMRPDSLRVLFSGYSAEQIGDVPGDGAAHAFLEKPMRMDTLIAQLDPILRARAETPG